MSAYEFGLWEAYYSRYPFTEDRADWRAAMLACTIANCHGAKTDVKEFIPKYQESYQGSGADLQALCAATAKNLENLKAQQRK